jgi:putative hemolysin
VDHPPGFFLAASRYIGIRALTIFLRPLVLASEWISRSLRGSKSHPVTSLDDIRLLATIGHSEGVVAEQTAHMIVGASQLSKLAAINVMVPRKEVVFLSGGGSPSEVLKSIATSGFSRFPSTLPGGLDEVVGVVHAKEALVTAGQLNAGRDPLADAGTRAGRGA